MKKSNFLSAAVLAGASFLAVSDVNAMAFATAGLYSIRATLYDANSSYPYDYQHYWELDYQHRQSWLEFGYTKGWDSTLTDMVFDGSTGWVSSTYGVRDDRDGFASSRFFEMYTYSRASGLTEHLGGYAIAQASLTLQGILLGPGMKVVLSGTYFLTAGTNQDYLTQSGKHEFASAKVTAVVSAVPVADASGKSMYFSTYFSESATPRSVWSPEDGAYKSYSYTSLPPPGYLDIPYENTSGSWQNVTLTAIIKTFTTSNIPLRQAPIQVPDGMNTALGGLLAFGVLSFVRRRG